jgi:hypothetical protein
VLRIPPPGQFRSDTMVRLAVPPLEGPRLKVRRLVGTTRGNELLAPFSVLHGRSAPSGVKHFSYDAHDFGVGQPRRNRAELRRDGRHGCLPRLDRHCGRLTVWPRCGPVKRAPGGCSRDVRVCCVLSPACLQALHQSDNGFIGLYLE